MVNDRLSVHILSGDDVTGHINLMLTHPLTVKNIEAKLKGTYIVAFELRTEGEPSLQTNYHSVVLCIYL